MSAIVKQEKAGGVTSFDPEQFKDARPKRDALIDYGRKLGAQTGDWTLVEKQVDEQLIHIQELLAWWEANVRHGGDRTKNSDLNSCLALTEAEEITGATQVQVSRWRGHLKDDESRERYRLKLLGPVYKKVFGIVHGTQGTGQDEWYTPEEYICAARKVLGGIELDPASSDEAQEIVRADSYFTINDNALTKEWKAASVFMNPPYSTEKVFDFVKKLCGELKAGNVGSAIMLVNNYTDTAWFHMAEEIAPAICFTRGRIKFIDTTGNRNSPTTGQVFFYFGEDPDSFGEVFREFGFVR